MSLDPPLKQHIILYADDDQDDLLIVRNALEKYTDIKLVTCADGQEALELLQAMDAYQDLPCLILLDMNMPRLTGQDTLKEIRSYERFSDIPVLMFTTSSFSTDREFANRYGAGFISKPLSETELAQLTENFLQHCRGEKSVLQQPGIKDSRVFTDRNARQKVFNRK